MIYGIDALCHWMVARLYCRPPATCDTSGHADNRPRRGLDALENLWREIGRSAQRGHRLEFSRVALEIAEQAACLVTTAQEALDESLLPSVQLAIDVGGQQLLFSNRQHRYLLTIC